MEDLILRISEVYPSILLTDFLRYFITASLAWLLFWVLFKDKWRHRIIQRKKSQRSKRWMEFRYSMSTVVVFSLVGCFIVLMKQQGYTAIYDDISDKGWLWFFSSIAILIVLHDAYFYWAHRLMHHPWFFRHVHLVHHRSTNPSPWAAYSFHPLEALVEAAFFPIAVLTIPLHGLALLTFLIYMIVRNVQGHLGVEFLPAWFLKSKWLNWMTTTTHHDMHHKNFHTNYGLYFTWWDQLFGTEDSRYKEVFEEVTHRPAVKKSSKVGKSTVSNALSLFFLTLPAWLSAQSPEGTWQTFHEESGLPLAEIQIESSDEVLAGRITKLYLQPWEGKDPICSKCPGDKRDKKVIGMTFLWGFGTKGGQGSILDPASGKIYKSKMWLESPQQLMVRGYAGPFNLFFRTQRWMLEEPVIDGNPYTGIWVSIDDESGEPKSRVLLEERDGQLEGHILEIYLQAWEGENPICYRCPEPFDNKRLVGMGILGDFRERDGKWVDGKIFDPGNGKTYAASLWLEGADTLKIRGYLGPFFRTQVWKRKKAI